MKTPTNIGGNNLATFLQNATEFPMADLYTITLKAGNVLRYTTWDSTLTVLGNTFLTGPPNIERTAIEEQLGMNVSTIEVTITAGASDLISGVQDRTVVYGSQRPTDRHCDPLCRLHWSRR